jgi:predicted nuclease of restriction endonuclease-like (RecB) superfamily
MTFGRDFTFVGNQYHLEVYGVEHFPDLLFFNRELNALVVVELICLKSYARLYQTSRS